jgi:hypothetical protein
MLTRVQLNMNVILIVMRNIHNGVKSNPGQLSKSYKISSGGSGRGNGSHNNNSNKKYLEKLF